MNLVKQLRKWFDVVIDANEFTIVVDVTGFYMFKICNPNDRYVEDAYQVLDVLALKEEEAKLIFLTNNPEKTFDSFTYETDSVKPFVIEAYYNSLEDVARKLIGVRNPIFSKKVIDSIVDCFMDVEETPTELQQELMKLGVPQEIAKALEIGRPTSPQEVLDLGCPRNLVEKVFAVFKDYYVVHNAEYASATFDGNNWEITERNAEKYNLMCGISLLIGVILYAVSWFIPDFKIVIRIVAVIVAVYCYSTAIKSLGLKETLIARISFLLSLAIIAAVIVPFFVSVIIKFVNWISHNLEETPFTVEYFDDIHW